MTTHSTADEDTGLLERKEFDPQNLYTVGAEFYGGKPCVTYMRRPKSRLKLPHPSPTPQPHLYQHLPSGFVRFLKRVRQPDQDLLVFEFVSCPVESIEGQYVAVSYYWGTLPNDRSLALADGAHIPITAKVEQMLADVVSRIQLEIIWLDAVCINQKDMAEKALQIPLMANIYQRAASVEIWLDYGDASRKAMAANIRGQSVSSGAVFDTGILREDDSYSYPPYSTPEIVELMWSPWFDRAWIVQEFCFGKNHQFHFGDITITELFLQKAYGFGSDLAFGRVVDENGRLCEIPIPPMIKNLGSLFSLHARTSKIEQRLEPLEDILCRFFSLKASDPRDKIFAMLGLAKGNDVKIIKPDYTQEAPDIYLNTMKAVLLYGSDYRLLGFSGLAAPRPLFESRPDIPSWVPDFSAPPRHTTWSSEDRFNPTNFPLNSGKRTFCFTLRASGEIPEDVSSMSLPPGLSPKNTTLMLRGACVDVVAGVLSGDIQHNLSRIPQLVLDAMEKIESLLPYPNGESARDVLWKTLIASNQECLERDPKGKGFNQFCEILKTNKNELSLDKAWEIEGRYYQTMIVEGTGGSRGLFWTKDNYVGLAANGVEAGDEIWLIDGARVPFIFRGPLIALQDRVGDVRRVYRLVCEAYVHGIMKGEMVDKLEEFEELFLT